MDATRAAIRRILLTEALTYLSIGHNWDKPFDTWVLMPGSDNIEYASKRGQNPEFFHDEHGTRADLKGRVDPGKRQISMVTERSRDPERIQYAAKVLTADHPGFEVWFFRSALAPPQKLTEERTRLRYLDIGHSEGSDSWVWDEGRLRFASEEGIETDDFHQLLGHPKESQFAGRYDPVLRIASLVPRSSSASRTVDRRATFVAKQLAKRLPDDTEILFFPRDSRGMAGQVIF